MDPETISIQGARLGGTFTISRTRPDGGIYTSPSLPFNCSQETAQAAFNMESPAIVGLWVMGDLFDAIWYKPGT